MTPDGWAILAVGAITFGYVIFDEVCCALEDRAERRQAELDRRAHLRTLDLRQVDRDRLV